MNRMAENMFGFCPDIAAARIRELESENKRLRDLFKILDKELRYRTGGPCVDLAKSIAKAGLREGGG